MEIGEKLIRTIDSRSKWNESERVKVLKDHKYHISANPEQKWKDKDKICDANGCIGNIFNKLGAILYMKRYNKSRWGCLIGCVNKNKPYFKIGLSAYFKSVETGQLYFFANDAWLFYGNNSGSIEITIERVM